MKKLALPLLILLLTACTTPIETPPVEQASLTPDIEETLVHLASSATLESPTETAQPTETPVPTATEFVFPAFTPFPNEDHGLFLIDGDVNDWSGLLYADTPPEGATIELFKTGVFGLGTLTDPSGDVSTGKIDMEEMDAAILDGRYLILRLVFGEAINLQSNNELTLYWDLDLSGDAELVYSFGGRRGYFDINGEITTINHSDFGLVTAPTVTASEFEIVVDLNKLTDFAPFFNADEISIWLADGETGDTFGTAAEPLLFQVPEIGYNFEPEALSINPPADSFRVVSWNVLRDNIFDDDLEPHFARVLNALAPDVILLQEIYTWSDKTALKFAEQWLDGEWFAVQQGDLITLSRHPFIEDWADGFRPLRARIFPTMIDINGQPVLIFNAHLSCCDDDENRQNEVDSFIAFLRDGSIPFGTPIIMSGDMNLVGNAQQVTTLLTGDIIDEETFGADHFPDWDGTPLVDLFPRHTNSNFTFTWRDPTSSFGPGRLDYMIYTDSLLNAQGFVFDTSWLDEATLTAFDLLAEDTTVTSDHLPLVGDYVIVE
jgi:exonuclease III